METRVKLRSDQMDIIYSLARTARQIDTTFGETSTQQLNKLKVYCKEFLDIPIVQALTGEL